MSRHCTTAFRHHFTPPPSSFLSCCKRPCISIHLLAAAPPPPPKYSSYSKQHPRTRLQPLLHRQSISTATKTTTTATTTITTRTAFSTTKMLQIQTWNVTEPYLDLKCGLGEGPYYEATRHHLRFVDIKKKRLHVIDLAVGPGSLKTTQLDMPVGVTADISGVDSSKKILIGGKHGIAVLDRETEQYEYLARFYDNSTRDDRLRSNDGTVDPRGRFWVGTMNDFHVGPPQPEGTLFRFDGDLKRTVMRDGLTIPNGIGWSLDHKSLFFTHSSEREIWKYDFDVESGSISNGRVWYKHEGEGEPDGFKMDVEGNIWQSVYNEGRVLRINPDGEVTGIVHLPTRSTSCPCFVGTELWVTSASEAEPDKYPESAKYGGGLFRVDVGIAGLEPFEFKLDANAKKL